MQLHDPSNYWSSKPMHTIIASSLCTPMILGLLFLAHNDIVVDAVARTVIDKKCGFDLLNPVPPLNALLPKKKLKDFYKELQEDRKLMVAELKMVCNDHLIQTHHAFKTVTPINVTLAVRQ